jgi:hypothetical protein
MNLFRSEQQIIAAIHNEIDTSAERLLTEAKEIINNLTLSDKADRLKSIGFINSETVKINEKKSKLLVSNKEQANLIKYYQSTYPFLLFLTENELDRICKKYGLVYAPVSRYLKDVPDKNIKEIENAAPLKSNDSANNVFLLKYSGDFKSDITKEQMKLYRNGIYVYREVFNLSGEFESMTGLSLHSSTWSGWDKISIDHNGLFIAAPKSHFNLKGLKKTSKFSFNLVTIQKDPIVFRYCRGGIQVLTKWGLEASDESLVNPVTN